MRTFLALILFSVSIWTSPLFAEYCTVNVESNSPSCNFRTKLTAKDAQIIVSHNQQGWTLTVKILLKEFAMIAGDSTVETKEGEVYNLEYVSTNRDIAPRRKWKESAVYLVSESTLRELGKAKGKLLFLLAAEDPKELKVKFGSGTFEDIDAFIAETRSVLGDQFQAE